MKKLFNKKIAGVLFGITALWQLVVVTFISPVVYAIMWDNSILGIIKNIATNAFNFGNILFILGFAALAVVCFVKFEEKISKIISISAFGALALSNVITLFTKLFYQFKSLFSGMWSSILPNLFSMFTSSIVNLIIIAALILAVIGLLCKKKVFYVIAASLGAAYILLGVLGSVFGLVPQCFDFIVILFDGRMHEFAIKNIIYATITDLLSMVHNILVGGSVAVFSLANAKKDPVEENEEIIEAEYTDAEETSEEQTTEE